MAVSSFLPLGLGSVAPRGAPIFSMLAVSNKLIFPELHAGQREALDVMLLSERTVIRAGRRWGKTTLLEYVAAKCALGDLEKAGSGLSVGWFGPDFRRNRPSFERVMRFLSPVLRRKSLTMLFLETVTGGSVEFWSMSDEDAGRSRSYDVVILDEATLAVREITPLWEEAIRPTLIDRGGIAIMAGTPKGIDPDQLFYRVCTDASLGWTQIHAPTAANPHLDVREVDRLKTEYPPLVYQQEVLAEFVDWSGEAFFSGDAWLVDGKPGEYPERCDIVFAVMDTAFKTGQQHDGSAVVFYAKNRFHERPLYILDWDVRQITGDLLVGWIPSVLLRLDELAQACGARMGSAGIWIEDRASGIVLLQQAQRRGFPVRPIDTKLTSMGKDERALAAVVYHQSGKCILTRHAADKVVMWNGSKRNHFMSQVLGYRPTLPMKHDDVLDCYTYGLIIGVGDSGGW